MGVSSDHTTPAMSQIASYLWYLLPWEFSPTVLGTCVIAVALYVRGLSRLRRAATPVGLWRSFAFLLGVALTYVVLQTYVDFLSQHMFWIHRFQHLVLHHIAPVLLVLSAPGPVLRAGIPTLVQNRLRSAAWIRRPIEIAFRVVQHPIVAPTLFVGLIYFWLTPSIHFDAMLDARRYRLMNWSMVADGIAFWWLMLAPRPEPERAAPQRRAPGQEDPVRAAPRGYPFASTVGYPVRLVILAAIAIPQILIGAYIALSSTPLYSVYAVCGRAWAISPLRDQQLGGLLTWVPAVMMSGLGVLVVVRHILHDERVTLYATGDTGADRQGSSHRIVCSAVGPKLSIRYSA